MQIIGDDFLNSLRKRMTGMKEVADETGTAGEEAHETSSVSEGDEAQAKRTSGLVTRCRRAAGSPRRADAFPVFLKAGGAVMLPCTQ